MCSPNVIDHIYQKTKRNPGFAMQKFNRLIATGFVKNHVDVSTLSALPVHRNESGWLSYQKADECNGIRYRYIPFINVPGLRQLSFFLYTFFFVILWGARKKSEKRLVFDMLNISVCIGGLLASKIIGLKSCGILTDMPGLMVGQNHSLKDSIITAINKSYLESFSSYIFLTDAMNRDINKKHRPYIIMEGLVDADAVSEINRKGTKKSSPRSLMYAGGLFERYGIRVLIEAFLRLDDKNLTLDLYGHGPMTELINEYHRRDNRVRFHGVVSNETIIDKELSASLLINPRPTSEEFTKYSFPSKNMEYMVSGTPVLTTKLPGMPAEYYPHIFTIDDESVDGVHKTLTHVLSLSDAQLEEKGREGKEFVLKKKNNVIQGRRIVELLKNI